MSTLSTHVLDTAAGKPAADIAVHLFKDEELLGSSHTNQDGRCADLVAAGSQLEAGTYELAFDIGDYFPGGFYPQVTILFIIGDTSAHYHVPLLISPYGYTTYRGS